MKKIRSAVGLIILTTFSSGCWQPAYNSPQDFIHAFVEVLNKAQENRYEEFYPAPSYFKTGSDLAEVVRNRFNGAVRSKFLSSCRGAAQLLAGKSIIIEHIEFGSSSASSARFLEDVEAGFSKVLVQLRADSQTANLLFEELIKVRGTWKTTAISITIDMGTERIEKPIELNLEESEDSEDSQPSNSR